MRMHPPIPLPFYHFSVDDVFASLLEMPDCESVPVPQMLRFLVDLHQSYGTQTDLYVFLQGTCGRRPRSLLDLSSRVCARVNALPGIRFGPHALDYATAPYAQSLEEQRRTFDELYRAIAHFVGPRQASRWVRLHYFSECFELAPFWRDKGVEALLLTDKEAIAYRLPE